MVQKLCEVKICTPPGLTIEHQCINFRTFCTLQSIGVMFENLNLKGSNFRTLTLTIQPHQQSFFLIFF